MKKTLMITSFAVACLVLSFCSKKDSVVSGSTLGTTAPNLPATPFAYAISYPAHIQSALTDSDNTQPDNPLTNDGATLGRVLFYDKDLSRNDKISCGSCHRQAFAFDDTARLSRGFEDSLTARNSMSLLNLRFYRSGKMFWDERAASVEKQALVPIQNHLEMGLTLAELEAKVKSQSYYPALFQKAFGSTDIDSIRIAKALAQFERSIVTYRSKYDRVKQGAESFTAAEAAGEQIFLHAAPPPGGAGPALACASCHTPPMFLNSQAPPFGIADATDAGIQGTTFFKSGSLRNVFDRTRLFHNGSVANLQQMLTAGAPGTGTRPIPAHSVAPADVQNLMTFLNTLTDTEILTDARFSDPFN
jgi:cytochrome c peroxidase